MIDNCKKLSLRNSVMVRPIELLRSSVLKTVCQR